MSSRLPRPLWVAALVLLLARLGWMAVEVGRHGFHGPEAETLAGIGAGAAAAVLVLIGVAALRRNRTS